MLPKRLPANPVVAIIAPSWGGVGRLPERAQRAFSALETFGAEVRVMPHAACAGDSRRPWVSASAELRAADLHQAASDPEVDVILFAIGGDHSAQMLPKLDWALIASRRPILCGHSDATVLLHAIHARTGLITFYGPSLLPQFGEIDGPDDDTLTHWHRTLGDSHPAGAVPEPSWQGNEDRKIADAEGRPRRRESPEPRRVLRAGRAEGRLLPGCLPSLRQLIGTPFAPDFSGALLALEAPGHGYRLRDADADMAHLANAGVLEAVGAVVLGRWEAWSAAEVAAFDDLVLEYTELCRLPVLAGVAFSHASPTLTLPIGVRAAVDGTDLVVLDSAVAV